MENLENKDIKYIFSEEDINNIREKIEYFRNIIEVIDEICEIEEEELLPYDLIDACDDADNALISLETLLNVRINKN